MAKLTTEEFIKKATIIHGDKYDYSKVKYEHSKTKVEIICKKHGEFEQTPAKHLFGRGCQKCAVDNTKCTTKGFIKKSTITHNNRYDYSKSKYINNDIKVEIICEEHGSFWQIPRSHINGRGCVKCFNDDLKLTFEEFISKAKAKHLNKYDYSKVKFIDRNTSVVIICPTHGKFKQTPRSHLLGRECRKCSWDAQKGKSTHNLKTTEQFITDAVKTHGDKYSYHKSDYINAKTKIEIICKKHGSFWQAPDNHCNIGRGCPKCNESHGEAAIAKYLDEHGIKYLRERKLGDTNLRYDFYIKKLNLIIEYDGRQHFEPVKDFGGTKEFKLIKERDAIKSQYCKDNGIRLIRISYKKFKRIDEVLDSIFIT